MKFKWQIMIALILLIGVYSLLGSRPAVNQKEQTVKPPSYQQMVLASFQGKHSTKDLAPGLVYHHLAWGSPAVQEAHVLAWDVTAKGIDIVPVLAHGSLFGYETISQMAAQINPLGGINGGFFDPFGRPLGPLVADGQVITSGVENTPAFYLTADGIPHIGPIFLDARAKIGDAVVVLDGINRPRAQDKVILFSRDYGMTTREKAAGISLVVAKGALTDIKRNVGGVEIPADGYVLSVYGPRAAALENLPLRTGDRVDLSVFYKSVETGAPLLFAAAGEPQLLRGGKIDAQAIAQSRILAGRSPRTAIALVPPHLVLLVAVDGRNPTASVGMTLTELAEFLRRLGATEAVNLDGGASTTMVLGTKVVNQPSLNMERPTAFGLFLVKAPK